MEKDFLSYLELKKYVKEKISKLEDYSSNEENVLIESTLKTSKEKLFLDNISQKDLLKINKVIKKRLEGKPLNKIFKNCFFYDSEFFINNNVLAPRKETELLVEKAIQIAKNIKKEKINILDLCCGSGAIGLSVAKENNNFFVVLSDISQRALYCAKKNRKNLNLSCNTKIIKSDLFKDLKIKDKFDIILSNPPYIKTEDIKNLSYGVKNYDPIIALDGGKDGLFFYKEICKNAKDFLNKSGYLIVEIGFDQKNDVKKLFENSNFSVECYKDYSNNDRIVVGKLEE